MVSGDFDVAGWQRQAEEKLTAAHAAVADVRTKVSTLLDDTFAVAAGLSAEKLSAMARAQDVVADERHFDHDLLGERVHRLQAEALRAMALVAVAADMAVLLVPVTDDPSDGSATLGPTA